MHQHQLKLDGYELGITAEEMLPTMYDLPSENPEEPGVPDLFHIWQPELLSQTFVPPAYARDRMLVATDLNLYYDVNCPRNYKRPDWYAVLDVPYLYGEEREIRLSYVMWREKIVPFIAVELLSPGTEDEDLGLTQRESDEPPTKWEVYEQILGIPYYAVFSRYTDRFRAFKHSRGQYNEMVLPDKRMWIPELDMGLGVWSGEYQMVDRKWLRWYDAGNNWIPTIAEKYEMEKQMAEGEKQRAEHEKQRAEGEKQRAEHEKQRAEGEKQRAEHEKQRAEGEKQRAEHEKQQKELIQQQLENEREQTKKLLDLLKASGLEPPA